MKIQTSLENLLVDSELLVALYIPIAWYYVSKGDSQHCFEDITFPILMTAEVQMPKSREINLKKKKTYSLYYF